MIRWCVRGWFVAAAMVALAACDEAPSVPSAVLEQAKQAEAEQQNARKNKKPTTQQLVEGKRSRTALIPLPLTMELPAGWGKLEDVSEAGLKVTSAGLSLLQGITPNGEVQIQLTNRPAIKQDELDRLMDAGKKEQAAKPQQIVKFELHPLGNVRVLERQSVGDPRPLTVFDQNNQPHTTTESIFNWTVTALVPVEGAFQRYELNFIGLTKSQYDKDKAFLEGILKTLQYAGETGAAPVAMPGGSGASGAAGASSAAGAGAGLGSGGAGIAAPSLDPTVAPGPTTPP